MADFSDGKFVLLRRHHLRELKDAAAARGISCLTIAEKTGLKPSNVSRLLNGKYSCTIDNFLKVADAIGAEMVILFKNK